MHIILIALFTLNFGYSQTENTSETYNRMSYYEKCAKEDAIFEQNYTPDNTEKEDEFWEDQRRSEKELKRRDRKAYRAYIRGKKEAYREHYKQCSAHCHHNDYYYHHASFYYHGYRSYYYERYPIRSSSIHTRVRVGTPRVRIGIL